MTSKLPDNTINPENKKKYTIDGVVQYILDSPTSTKYTVKNTHLEHTYIIDSTSGKDTISYSDEKDILHYRDADFENLTFLKSKNDLIIKQDNKNTTTLKDFFSPKRETKPLDKIVTLDSENHEINNSISNDAYIQISGNKTITALDGYNTYIKGGKKADKMYGNENKNILEGGKGNDTYYINSDSENEIRVNKGDGNDTVVLNKSDNNVVSKIVFGEDTEFSYSKSDDDLIITGTHSGKKIVSETVTIKDYFVNDDMKSVLTLYKGSEQVNISEDGMAIVGSKKEKTLYEYIGTDNSDIITTDKKTNSIVYSGKGDDKIIISAISKGTVISDTEGNDTLQINGINAKDIRFVVDYASDDLFLTDSKGVKALKDFGFFSGDADLETYAKKIKGVLIKDYSNKGKIETIQIADSKGNNVHTLSNSDIETIIDELKHQTKTLIEGEGDWSGLNGGFDSEHKFYSVQELFSRSTKDMTSDQKDRVKYAKEGIIDMYNANILGSNGDDTFSLDKTEMVIYSGKGSDTYTKNNKKDANIDIYADCTDGTKKDNIKIKNYAFENGAIQAHGWYHSSNIDKMNYLSINTDNEKVKIGSVNYYVNTKEEFDGLTITDSKRTYDVIFNSTWDYENKDYFNKDELYKYDWSNDNKNHLAFFDISPRTLKIISNKGYNRIETNGYSDYANDYNIYYTYAGGHDVVSSGSHKSNDTYKVDMSDKVNLDIADAGGSNNLVITNLKDGVDNFRIFFEVNYDGSNWGGRYNHFMTAENLKNSNFIKTKNSFDGVKDGIDYNGNISTLTINEQEIDYSKTYEEIKSAVAGWLKGTDYYSATQVLQEGSTSEINTLLTFYNKAFDVKE